MTTAKRVVRNSFWLLFANVVVRMISAFVFVILARVWGKEVFGQYSFAIAFVGFFTLVANFGFSGVIVRDVAKNKSLAGKYLGNVMSMKIFFSIIAFLLLFIVSFFINKPDFLRIAIYIFGLEIIISGFDGTLRCIFQAYEKMEYDALTNIIYKVLWAIFILLIIFNYPALVSVALATLASVILSLTITYFIVAKKFVAFKLQWDFGFWKQLILEAYPFTLIGLFSLINFRIDQVMLSFMRTDAAVGIYNASYKIIDMLAIVPSILLTALYPVFSRFHQDNKLLLKKSFNLALRYLAIACIPIVIGVFLIADKIIILLYGSGYLESISVLKILIFISLISFINTPLFVALNAIGKQRITMINTAFTALANIVMNSILIPIWGINGAALATIISELTFFALSSYHLRKTGFDLGLIKKFSKPIISGIIMIVAILLLINASIFIIIPVAAITYFAALILLREFNNEDINLMKTVMTPHFSNHLEG
jgi:O-antigen/teichoic acid export membrane protein